MITRNSVIAALAVLSIAACDRDEPVVEPVDLSVQFGSGRALLVSETDTLTIGVEVAETDGQRRLGMMQRTSLDADSGMIFLFPEEQGAAETFWMYNTLIPLSIAFIDADGRIGSIREMVPCPSPYPQYCPQYASGVPFVSALEVNPGFFEAHGMGVGDHVHLQRP